jgi:hypothetical protein
MISRAVPRRPGAPVSIAPDRFAMSDLRTYGVRIASELELPELAMGTEAALATDEAELTIGRGDVPDRLAGAGPQVQGLQYRDGRGLLTVGGVARYLIEDGRSITVEAEPGAADNSVRLFLLGSALGVALHQRGVLPLHACCVAVGGAGYAFCGHSGAGKSTLAGQFADREFPILSDDVCAIRFADGEPLVWPAPPRIKLWGEAAAALGHDRAGLESVTGVADKYHVPLAQPPAVNPVRLRRLYLLAKAETPADAGIVRLTGARALQVIVANTYRREYLAPMGLAQEHFALCSALLARIEVFEIKRSWGFDAAEREFQAIREHLEHDAAPAATL